MYKFSNISMFVLFIFIRCDLNSFNFLYGKRIFRKYLCVSFQSPVALSKVSLQSPLLIR